jgi:hypothetical protein
MEIPLFPVSDTTYGVEAFGGTRRLLSLFLTTIATDQDPTCHHRRAFRVHKPGRETSQQVRSDTGRVSWLPRRHYKQPKRRIVRFGCWVQRIIRGNKALERIVVLDSQWLVCHLGANWGVGVFLGARGIRIMQ